MPIQFIAPAQRFVLNIDQQNIALQDMSGGHVEGEVVTVRDGATQQTSKSISRVRFTPFVLKIGAPIGKTLAEWARTCADLKPMKKSGYVAAIDLNGRIQGYRHFRDALIEKITVPAMDGASKEAAIFTITLEADGITYAPGDNTTVAGNVANKPWLSSNFRFRLGDLPCSRVAKVDSFTINQEIFESASGTSRISTKQPAGVDFPNLKVTFAATDAAPWHDWFTDLVVNGNTGKELKGSLEFLGPDLSPVGRIDFLQVGIFSLHEDRTGAQDTVARYVAELYVEKMTLAL